MNASALDKIRLSKESIDIVSKLKTDISALDKVRLSRRLNEIIIALGGQVSTAQTAPAAPVGDGLSDKTTDENYRWKDTADIAGARKHMAVLFKKARDEGRNIVINELDWQTLAGDSRMAQSLITKKNLFGVVNWQALRDGGMQSEVGYLISRIYRAVDKAPLVPTNNESLQNYVRGITSLRQQLEACKTPQEVQDAVVEISRYLTRPKYMLEYYKNPDQAMMGVRKLENLETRVYTELGNRFYSWIFKSGNKALHECRTGRNPDTGKPSNGLDWKWLEGEPKLKDSEGKPKAPKKTKFQLEVADNIERVGGTPVNLQSSQELQDMFGLRGVQSGNWVLKDKGSAEFHMNGAAGSMLDMGDILGISPKDLGLQGNLALAFGARGKSGALAHYEPGQRVINMTKIRGGGFFGHEYFHAIDNLIRDFVEGPENASIDFYGTRDAANLKDLELKDAFLQLQKALNTREGVMYHEHGYINLNEPLSDNWRERLERSADNLAENMNMGRDHGLMHSIPLDELSEQVNKFYIDRQRRSNLDIRGLIEREYGNYLVLRHYVVGDVQREGDGLVVNMPGATSQSQFYKDSLRLDDGKMGKYWSSTHEMAARAFSAYLEDKLTAMGRKNTYLTFGTIKNGKGTLAHPDGTERQAINTAFDKLFEVIRKREILKTAGENQALMDSIFGNNAVFNEIEEDHQDEFFPIYDDMDPEDDDQDPEDDDQDPDDDDLDDMHDSANPDEMLGLAAAAIAGKIPGEMIEVHDVVAQAAATSELNDGLDPTQAQMIDDDYQKPEIDIAGLKITIENPIGSVRRGVDEDGQAWETTMTAHYGYINGTVGADGEELDVFVAPDTPQDYQGRVFILDQIDKRGRFDEHKVVLGVTSKVKAMQLYRDHYDENFNGVSAITEMGMDDFKTMIFGKTALFDSMQGLLLDSWAQDGIYEMIPTRKLDISKLNPQTVEAKATVKDPIVVYQAGSKYYVIHGANRLAIAKKNGESLIPAIIFSRDDGYSDSDIQKAMNRCGSVVHAEALGALIQSMSERRLIAAL